MHSRALWELVFLALCSLLGCAPEQESTRADTDTDLLNRIRSGTGRIAARGTGTEPLSGELRRQAETLSEQLDRSGLLATLWLDEARSELADRTHSDEIHGDTPRGKSPERIYSEKSNSTVVVYIRGQGMGSGVLLDEPSLVVTNWHVMGSSRRALVIFRPDDPGDFSVEDVDGRSAKLIAVDPGPDLALLRLDVPDRSKTDVELGDLGSLNVGSQVFAIGHPVGEWWTFTTGTVSQIRKNYEWKYEDGTQHGATVIQTQTPINPGSSGGPLFNDKGKLVGLNSFMNPGAGFLNYAVAADTIEEFMKQRPFVEVEPPPSQPAQRQEQEWRVLGKYDTDEDGRVDVYEIDSDGDGKRDFWVVDRDGDGKIDVFLFDTNDNGRPDAIGKDTDGDGNPDVYLIDRDEDGEYDQRAEDTDGDGKVEVRPI